MSLLSSLQLANNSLIATQVGLQVVGNNIANASTPGYTRQDVLYTPAPTQMLGTLPLGLGVQVDGIIQYTDRFLAERLRGATSDAENTEAQRQAYLNLESIIGELSETDLSTSLGRFFSSLQDVINQPEDLSVRNLAVLEGQTLTEDIRRLAERVRQIRSEVNGNVEATAADINRLTEEIAELNVQIVSIEGTSTTGSQAGGLRDQRNLALDALAKIIGIRTVEQSTGAVTVFAGGDYLVFEGTARPVEVVHEDDGGLASATIHIVDSNSPIETSSGALPGLYAARDRVLGGFLDTLDSFTRTLIFEFNKVHASGQGLAGYDTLVAEHGVTDRGAALDQAGLAFTPVNGSFQLKVHNRRTGLTTTTDIRVDLNGLEDDTSLESLAAQLDATDGITASIDSQGRLEIAADSPVLQFAFAADSSGVLASLGLNTFFAGTAAGDVTVSEWVAGDPGKFATSQSGVGEDTLNGVALAGMANTPLTATGGLSLTEAYEQLTSEVFQASSTTQAVNLGFRTFQKTLEGQHLGISGVNIDEQAVRMIQHQRVFQASARLIQSINELLDVLVNL